MKGIETQTNMSNQSHISSYRSIFKATSLFGGVQLWKILIQVIKQKAIALLLGTAGMGISGLYTSSINLIQGLTSLGLDKSAVKNVAEANGNGNLNSVSRVVSALQRLVWITGILGMTISILFAPVLSKSAFGTYDYTIPFILLSISILLQQLTAGQSVILQGLRKLKNLATANVLGSFFGLIISLPIYYLFGIKGIVPTLILDSFITLLLTYYFSHKIKLEPARLTNREILEEGKGMLGMGLAMALNGVMVTGVAYITNIFISRVGGAEQVGLYAAGLAIINSYVGMVFNAMSTDYYPRLASLSNDNEKCKSVVNQQAEVATLIIAPLACIFILSAVIIIKLLYSNEFLDIVPFMQIAMLGMLFKVGSWAISYIFLAKGDVKVFVINEFGIKCFNLPLYLILYYMMGLKGIGLGFLINYMAYFCLVYFIAYRKYNYQMSSGYKMLLLKMLLFVIITFTLLYFMKNCWVTYTIAIFVTFICCCFSLRELDKRLSLKSFIIQKLHK